jgi:hypothetical protein
MENGSDHAKQKTRKNKSAQRNRGSRGFVRIEH